MILNHIPYLQFASLLGFVFTMHPWLQTDKHRQWILSTTVNTVVSIAGAYQLLYWLYTGDITPGTGSNFLADFLYGYMLADLIHNGWYYAQTMNPLEFWVHHIIYIFLFDTIRTHQLTGFLRGFFIMELPSAIRAWGTMNSSWRSDTTFGVAFFLCRVLLPFYVYKHIYAASPWWSILPFSAAQCMHIYWFALWCKGTIRRLRTATPPVAS